MLRRKLRESLTARIFLTTFGILLLAAGITFLFLAWVTPITYVTVMTDNLSESGTELASMLDQSSYEEADVVLSDFLHNTNADITIIDPEGELDRGLMGNMVITLYENSFMVIAATEGTDDVVEDTEDAAISRATVYSSGSLDYPFSFSDREGVYTLSLSPPTQVANQAVQAMYKVAPWLFLVMLVFSFLCAFFYSHLITKPIVRLSGISQKMADLDFGWSSEETREDEIGILGRNLDTLSMRLSTALSELKEANAALQRDIERERELERQRLAFFSAVSHELKTPVTILKGQLAGMLEGVDVYRDRDKYLARALQVTGRMETLIQEIMTVARMEGADLNATLEILDLAALLKEPLSLYGELVALKGLNLQTALLPGITVSGDRRLLGKALDNILSNAVFYSQEGATVRVKVGREEERAILVVENSGVHIPEKAFPHLFDAFYRVEQSRNRGTGGSGLGLYLVKLILDRYGAAYVIENTFDGVRFTIRFAS